MHNYIACHFHEAMFFCFFSATNQKKAKNSPSSDSEVEILTPSNSSVDSCNELESTPASNKEVNPMKNKSSRKCLPSEIELPSHYPPRLEKELDKCKREHCRLNELSRNHLIRVLSDFFYYKVQDPTPAQYTAMSSAIVRKFPFLADKIPGVDSYVC